jgi:predicted methyltransferase
MRMLFASSTIGLFVALLSGCASFKRFAYEGWGRDRWQKPDEVITTLGLRARQSIADIGSGGGYFTFRFARAVGPTGKVYAVDIDEDLTEYVRERAREEGLLNIQVILARPDDPRLPEGSIDILFTSNTYHHIENRTEYFARARKYLRPGGRLAIVEHAGKSWFTRLFGHYTSSEAIRTEMTAAGYTLEHEYDFLPRQHFLVFAAAAR